MAKKKSISTEEQILDAAKQVFLEQGFDGARMQTIADKANINKAMLHYYFRTKKLLFDKIMEDIVQTMTTSLLPAISIEGTVMEKIESLVSTYIDTMLVNSHIPMFMLNEISQNRLEFQDKLFKSIEDKYVFMSLMQQIMQEQKQGILKEYAPHHIMLTLMSLMTFPFIAKPVLTKALAIPDPIFQSIMEERKTIVVDIMKSSFLN